MQLVFLFDKRRTSDEYNIIQIWLMHYILSFLNSYPILSHYFWVIYSFNSCFCPYYCFCVPITVAHDVLLFLCCLWSFVFQWKQNTHCRTVSYVSYMLQIHIRLSFFDLVFKVVLCWYQNSCIVSMLHLNSTTTNVLLCMNVICLLFS